MLAARIDRLPSVEKSGLQAAAVVGRVFWRPSVLHLTLGEEPDFALLEERDLITAHRGSVLADDGEFAFKHALTREVAYGSIPKARRGRLHAALADWLESGIGHDEARAVARVPLLAGCAPGRRRPGLGKRPRRSSSESGSGRALADPGGAACEAAFRSSTSRSSCCPEPSSCATTITSGRSSGERSASRTPCVSTAGRVLVGDAARARGPSDDEERADLYSVLAFQTSNRSGMWGVQTIPELVNGWRSVPSTSGHPTAKLGCAG